MEVAPGAPMAASEARVARARCVVFFDDEQKWFADEVVSSRAVTDNPRPGEPSSESAHSGSGAARMYLVRFDDGDEVDDLRLEELRHPRDGAVAPVMAMAPMTTQSAAGSAAAAEAAVAGAIGVPCTSASPDALTPSKMPAEQNEPGLFSWLLSGVLWACSRGHATSSRAAPHSTNAELPLSTNETGTHAAPQFSNEMRTLARLVHHGVIAAVPLRPDEVSGRGGCAIVVALMRASSFAALSRRPLSDRELDLLARSRSPSAVALLAARVVEYRVLQPNAEWSAAWRHALRDADALEPTVDEVSHARASPFTGTYRAERNICLGNGRGGCRLRSLLARLGAIDGAPSTLGDTAVDDDAYDDDDDAHNPDHPSNAAARTYGPLHAARTVDAARGKLEPIGAATPLYRMSTDTSAFFACVGVNGLIEFREGLSSALKSEGALELSEFVANRLSAPEVAVLACECSMLSEDDRSAFEARLACSSTARAARSAWRAEINWSNVLRRRERGLRAVPCEEDRGVLYDAPTALCAFVILHKPDSAPAAANVAGAPDALQARIASLESELAATNAQIEADLRARSRTATGLALMTARMPCGATTPPRRVVGALGGRATPPTLSVVEEAPRRRSRCNACAGCRAVDCGQCRTCRNSTRFGGPGTLRQACEHRRCSRMVARPPKIAKHGNFETYCDDEDEEDVQPTKKLKPTFRVGNTVSCRGYEAEITSFDGERATIKYPGGSIGTAPLGALKHTLQS
jgi:hypothetical protein